LIDATLVLMVWGMSGYSLGSSELSTRPGWRPQGFGLHVADSSAFLLWVI